MPELNGILPMEKLTVITHYFKDDKDFERAYALITIHAEDGYVIAEYDDKEVAMGFVNGVRFVFTDVTVEYQNIADRIYVIDHDEDYDEVGLSE